MSHTSPLVEAVVENPDSLSIADVIATLPESHRIIDPLSFFTNQSLSSESTSEGSSQSTTKNVLLILNQKINIHPTLFQNIWSSACIRVCADGGLNRLHDYDPSYIPDYVVGDLDSVKPEVIASYKSIKTILQSSQYYTDFTKSVEVIKTHLTNPEFLDNLPDTYDSVEKYQESNTSIKYDGTIKILLLGGVGGRFDQSMQIISQLHNTSITDSNIDFALLNSEHDELIIFLHPGVSFINYPKLDLKREVQLFGSTQEKTRPGLRNVGVLSILKEAVVSTHGLKWDVTNWKTSIVSKMSSSNMQIADEGFIIETNQPIIVNFEL